LPTWTSMGFGKPLLAMRPEDLRGRLAISFLYRLPSLIGLLAL